MSESIIEKIKDQGREDISSAGAVSKGGLVSYQEMSQEEYIEICKENNLRPSDLNDEQKLADEFDWSKADGTISKERIITIKGSDESTDRDGDIIRVDGWDLTNFKSNPVFLTHHNSKSMPVGRVVRVWKASGVDDSPYSKALMFRVYFPTADEVPAADAVFRLYKTKLLNAVSVGFRIKKGNYPATDEDRNSLGLGRNGIEITEAELHELSAVSIPANQNALVVRSLDEAQLCKDADVDFQIELTEDELDDSIAPLKNDGVVGDEDEGEDFVKVPKKVLDLLISKIQSTEEKVDKLLEKNLSSLLSEDESQELNDEPVDATKGSESETTDDDLDAFATILKGFTKSSDDGADGDRSSISELLLKSFKKEI